MASSVWKPHFKRQLDVHPDCNVHSLRSARLTLSEDRYADPYYSMSVPLCDACHIGGRVATLAMMLTGRRYDRDTYQPLRVSFCFCSLHLIPPLIYLILARCLEV